MSERKIVPKAWGFEVIVANREFAGKILSLRPGFRCSAHYHQVKDETFYVLKGRMRVEIGDPGWMARFTVRQGRPVGVDAVDVLRRCRIVDMEPGMSLDVEPFTLHRFTGVGSEPCEFAEFSSHDDPADSIRVTESGPVPSADAD
jgi:mannose-6-phosphate isomerase-like protein (cupin superfamily)